MSVTIDGVKTFEPLPVPSSEFDNGLYTVKATAECQQSASDDQIQSRFWFSTPALDDETIKRLHSIQLFAECRDQGFADVPSAGNWTWFEIGVYVDASGATLKEKDGVKLVWKSHPNRFLSNSYDWSNGMIFDKKHEIFGLLSPGNVIGIRLCARFPGWEIMAKSGYLVVELGPKLGKRTVPEFKAIVHDINAMQELISEANAQFTVAFTPSPVQGLRKAETYTSVGERPLRVLSLDGGGVRGLSSLYILNEVMKKAAPGKKPCEVFDMIAGTSAGGLTAIMLGRLKLSVDECIKDYETLSRTIFKDYGKIDKGIRVHKTGARYDSSILENAFREYIGQRTGNQNEKLLNEEGSCKVFVMAVREDADNNRGPVFLRSYSNPQTLSPLPDCLIWQAGRATSAAPSYFTPIKVGDYTLVDGGLLANNPLGWLWSEVLDVFGPARRTDCFLSIGTGIPANQRVGQAGVVDRRELADGLSGSTTNTQLTHILFKSILNAYAPDAGSRKYWRMNVGEYNEKTDNYKDIGDLDDLTKIDGFRTMTENYIKSQQELIDGCATKLSASLAA
ncbi:acyl transferase/acyl hydrolase/lysophospholipase [Crucibulum laeve]|uniref:Acyl transferase/acyl hydrolase/lysophospholipase n=1 Tax=Crucibulum laeve TaxID=68775 RepID=A0A5C3LV99_9AGAR|nr:acyl transferase/acyl hydrolase/lysophospholipase [Crucibulum laeve]